MKVKYIFVGLVFFIQPLVAMEEDKQNVLYEKLQEECKSFKLVCDSRIKSASVLRGHVAKIEKITDRDRRIELLRLSGESIKASGYDVNDREGDYDSSDSDDYVRDGDFDSISLVGLICHDLEREYDLLVLFFAGLEIELKDPTVDQPLFFYGSNFTQASYDFLSVVLPAVKNPGFCNEGGGNLFHCLCFRACSGKEYDIILIEKMIDLLQLYKVTINAVETYNSTSNASKIYNSKRKTPLDFLMKKRRIEPIIELFRKKGALEACTVEKELWDELPYKAF